MGYCNSYMSGCMQIPVHASADPGDTDAEKHRKHNNMLWNRAATGSS